MKEIIVCGAVVFNKDKVLIIQHKKGHYEFPKGHLEVNENYKDAAIREVKEETGVEIEITDDKFYEINFYTKKNNFKRIFYYIAKPLNNNIKLQLEEVLLAKYVSYNECLELLTHDNSKDMFKEILKDLNLNY